MYIYIYTPTHTHTHTHTHTAVRRLVEQGGANPNAKDEFFGDSTALHLAASQGHTRVVRELIRLGAQVATLVA